MAQKPTTLRQLLGRGVRRGRATGCLIEILPHRPADRLRVAVVRGPWTSSLVWPPIHGQLQAPPSLPLLPPAPAQGF